MKVCNNCGTSLQDNATFCTNCGKQFIDNSQRKTKTPVSVGGWIGRSLIPYIPLVGGIVYLIMLFIWSGNSEKEDSFRNWAKAQLIVIAIVVVLTILFAVFFGVVASDIIETIMYSF